MAVHRIALLDHWKLLLIWLVVLGHILPGHQMLQAAIYSFHMPAFVFLAGLSSRPRPSWTSQAEIALLLILFHAGYVLLLHAVGWQVGRWRIEPAYIMWFFASLLAWRWMLRPVLWTGWPLTTATLLAVAAGMIPWVGVDFSASRTFVFLPFFVAGHLYGMQLVDWVQQHRRWPVSLSSGVLGLGIAFACAYLVGGRTVLFEGKLSYVAMSIDPWSGLIYRLGQLLAAAVISACFFATAAWPWRWAHLGANTRQVYLFHGFVAVPLAVWLNSHQHFGEKALLLCMLTATAVVAVLSQPSFAQPIDRVLRTWIRFLRQCMTAGNAIRHR